MKSQTSGTASLIILALLYSLHGVFNRMIGSDFLPFGQQLIRNILVTVLVLVSLSAFWQKMKPLQKSDVPWFSFWLIVGSPITAMLFLAFNNLPISTTYFLFYATMTITGIICGRFMFQEKINANKLISVVLVILGLLLTFSVSFEGDDVFYVILTLLSGVFLGMWRSSSKKFSHHYHGIQLVLWDALGASAAGIIGMLIFRETLPVFHVSVGWLWMLVFACVQIVTVLLVLYGFRKMDVQIASLIMPIEIVFATIFSYIIFGEMLSSTALIGGLLIVCASILPSLNFAAMFKTRRSKQKLDV